MDSITAQKPQRCVSSITSISRKKRLERMRQRRQFQEKVQIHHVIPQQFKKHPVLVTHQFDVEDGYNLIFLPSGEDMIKTNRPVHFGGHPNYNEFCKVHLDHCQSQSDIYMLMLMLLKFLKGKTSCKLPWG